MLNNLYRRLPVGGLFLSLMGLGMLLYALNTESYVRSLCLALVIINGINLLIYPFSQTLELLKKRSGLNQWQARWLAYQVVTLLLFGLLIDFVM